MKIYNLLLGLLLGLSLSIKADTIKDVDFFETGGNYYNYPWLENNPPIQILPPDGYIPFHLEHFGRHGSRWLIGDYYYDVPYNLLKKAKEAGKLTPLGEEVFEVGVASHDEFKRLLHKEA